MSFTQWLFGGIEKPYKGGQWGALHIATLLTAHVLQRRRNGETLF